MKHELCFNIFSPFYFAKILRLQVRKDFLLPGILYFMLDLFYVFFSFQNIKFMSLSVRHSSVCLGDILKNGKCLLQTTSFNLSFNAMILYH